MKTDASGILWKHDNTDKHFYSVFCFLFLSFLFAQDIYASSRTGIVLHTRMIKDTKVTHLNIA